MRDRWKRDLPLEELVFDRWERAQSLGFKEGANYLSQQLRLWRRYRW
jgi:hypothetical protein